MTSTMSAETKQYLKEVNQQRPTVGQNLSPRERRVMTYTANGYTVAQTAQQMGLTVATVTRYRSRALAKLGARSITHAAIIAAQLGLVRDKDIEIPRELSTTIPRLSSHGQAAAQSQRSNAATLKDLSSREREVLILKANGKTSQQIATLLGIKKTTVTNHLTSIYRKLHAANETQACSIGIGIGEIGIHQIIIPDSRTSR
jgi:DNA-binding NarL/FixJ family response regulator